MSQEMQILSRFSRHIGSRQAYVQGGGGNTSVKNKAGLMWVKASGTLLKEMSENKGAVVIRYPEFLSGLNPEMTESQVVSLTKSCMNSSEIQQERPSMETGFHALLDEYVIHTHSVYVNSLMCSKQGHQILTQCLSGISNWCVVPYHQPGLFLTMAVKNLLKNAPETQYFFLQNHGLIVTGNTVENVVEMHDRLNTLICDYLKITPDFPEVSIVFDSDNCYRAELSYDLSLEELQTKVLFPDQTVYVTPALEMHGRTMVFRGAPKMAQSAAETLQAYGYIRDQIQKHALTCQYLTTDQIEPLRNMSSEDYRKKVLG